MTTEEKRRRIGILIAEWQERVQEFDEIAAGSLGLNVSDLRALSAVMRRPGISPSEMAEALGLSRAATTAVIDRCERAGYMERLRSIEDRRAVILQLTPDGAGAIGEIWGPLQKGASRLLSRYETEEIDFLLEFFDLCIAFQAEQTERLRGSEKRAARNPRRRHSGALPDGEVI